MTHPHTMRLAAPALLVLGLVMTAGCGDDGNGATATQTRVVIQVVDTQGRPVSGLDVALAPDTPYYQDGRASSAAAKSPPPEPIAALDPPYPDPFYPTTKIEFVAPVPANVRLTIEDVVGEERRVLIDDPVAAGVHTVIWDGREQDGSLSPSGVYDAHLTMSSTSDGSPLLDASEPMLLARLNAGDTGIGATDARGSLVLTDRRLFPFLYDLDRFPAQDENGDEIGWIELTPTMIVYLSDPDTGQRMRFTRDVEGPCTLDFVWDPPL